MAWARSTAFSYGCGNLSQPRSSRRWRRRETHLEDLGTKRLGLAVELRLLLLAFEVVVRMTREEQRRMLDEEELAKTRFEGSDLALRGTLRLVERLTVVLLLSAVAELECSGEAGVGRVGGRRASAEETPSAEGGKQGGKGNGRTRSSCGSSTSHESPS